MLPMLAVLQTKYLVNPSFVHVWFTLLLTLPVAILFVPWREWTTRRMIAVCEIISVAAVGLCFSSLRQYNIQADRIASNYYSFYQLHSWSDLGENLTTPTPSAGIAERVQAIRERAGTYDKLLVLSPFDFLMGFYANPEHYCGHFDILTNLITSGTFNSIVQCVKNSPRVMVVYDEALNIPCTEVKYPFSYDRASCEAKRTLKKMETGVLRAVKPYLVETARVGSLTFYSRNDNETGTRPPCKEVTDQQETTVPGIFDDWGDGNDRGCQRSAQMRYQPKCFSAIWTGSSDRGQQIDKVECGTSPIDL